METLYSAIGEQRTKTSVLRRQMLLCLASGLFVFKVGLGLGSPTVVVPQLRKRANSTEAVSEEMASWIASIGGFTLIPSSLILVIMSHYIGRKKTWIFTSIVTFVSFTVFACSKNIVHVFISQLLSGVTASTQLTVSPMIMTECSSPKYRGLIFAIKSATFVWGIWCANAIGTFCPYNYIGVVGIVCSVFNFIIISAFLPETPFWLAFKGRYDECAVAHRWLKGVDEDAERELNKIIKSQKDRQRSTVKFVSPSAYCKKYVTIVCRPQFYKPVSLGLLVMFMYNASGKIVYSVYAVEILKKITKGKSTAHNAMLILDGCSVAGMYMGCILAKILRRRTLFLGSSTISAILMFVISFYLYLVKLKVISEDNYGPIFLLVLYSISTCCGPVLLFSAICSELFPIKSRNFSILFIAVFKGLFFGSFLKFAPLLFSVLGIHGLFLFFALLFSVCIIICYKFLPETKDKTLHEIAATFE